MQKHDETHDEYLARLAKVAINLTQDQVEACAWVMGGSGCGWTPESVSENILRDIPPEP
jgi:hypothetical protein